MRRTRLLAGAVALFAIVLPAQDALANGVITQSGSTLSWAASAGTAFADTVTIQTSFSGLSNEKITFSSAPTIAVDLSAPACSGGGTPTVVCTYTIAGGPSLITGDGADLNDSITFISGINAAPIIPLSFQGGAGNDTLVGGLGNDTLNGGQGDDAITGSSGNDTIHGNDGASTQSDDNDTIEGNTGADTITGDGGDDVIRAGTEADSVNGGTGTDRIRYDDPGRAGPVTVNLADNAPDGSAADGTEVAVNFEGVTGSPGNDDIVGNSSSGRFDGGPGDDRIVGGGGADLIDGGTGSDTADYSASSHAHNLSLNGPGAFDDDDEGSAPTNDQLVGIEHLIGGSGNDNFSWTAASGAASVVFEGNAGNDVLTGSSGDDTLTGGAGGDAIDGAGGNDTTSYADHPDGVAVTVDSGAGDDGSAFDAGAGGVRDTIAGVEHVIGSPFADSLSGGSASEVLDGGDGNDLLQGGGGADVLNGGAGVDTASYAERPAGSPVSVSLNGAADDGAAGEGDLVASDVENLTGGAGADTLSGSDGPNALVGGDGNDVLTGAGGVDAYFAGAGADQVHSIDGLAEPVDCGDGVDTAESDPADTLTACESAAVATPSVDADGDGFPANVDCNDHDGAVHPNAPEVPGNAVDENCDGVVAAFPLIGARASYSVKRFGQSVRFKTFAITKLPAGSVVQVTCKAPKRQAHACAFKRLTRKIAKSTAKLVLTKSFKGRKLPSGTALELRVTGPRTTGLVVGLKVKGGRLVKTTSCLPAGATKPSHC